MRLVCAISHHGLGHLAQTAPVLEAIQTYRPDTEWLIWSGLSRPMLETKLDIPFRHRHEATDIGLVMQDAVRVDIAGSLNALAAFHRNWQVRVEQEARWLGKESIQGMLSNVGYLPLAAGTKAGLPSIGFCSLNWLDIGQHYLAGAENARSMFDQMHQAYLHSDLFLKLLPALPMDWLHGAQEAPAVAALGCNRREELTKNLGLDGAKKLVIVGLGGVDYQPRAPLAALNDIHWLVPDTWPVDARKDISPFTRAEIPFRDVLASSNALVTKVGYGSFVEAAGLGLPVIYIDRPDWPETPYLAPWLKAHGRAIDIQEDALFTLEIGEHLRELWEMPSPLTPSVNNAPSIARRIVAALER